MPDQSISWIDVGAFNEERSDYPLFAQLVCKEIVQGNAKFGVLVCGTGVGMAIAANRFRGIYAALAWNEHVARLSKEDDNANVLVLPSDFVSPEESIAMIRAWLSAKFQAGRYQQRLAMIDTHLPSN